MPSDLAQGTQLVSGPIGRGWHGLDAGMDKRESSGAIGGVTGVWRH